MPFLLFRFHIGRGEQGVERFFRLSLSDANADSAQVASDVFNGLLSLIHPFVDMEALQQHITTELKKQQPEPKETPR
jgi:hypothetical protein